MNKRTLIAVGVFAALLIAVVVSREDKVEVGIQRLELPKIERELVVGLEVGGPQAATLRKEANGWVVVDVKKPDRSHPVDQAQIVSALDALLSFKAPLLVTDNPARHPELEVDEAKGLKVKVLGTSGPLVELVFGKTAQSGGVYVRQAGKPAVFTTPSPLGWSIRKDASGWRKRSLVSFQTDEVSKVLVKHSDGTDLEVEREGGTWRLPAAVTLPAGFRFDPGAVDRLVQQLSTLSAQEFLDEQVAPSSLGLEPAATQIQVQLKGAQSIAVALGRQTSPEDSSAINRLINQFAKLDADSDGKLTSAELEKGKGDSNQEVKEAAGLFLATPLFARVDSGWHLSAQGDGTLTRDELTQAQRGASMVPARVDGEPQVYLVPLYAAQGLSKRLSDLRDLSLLSVSAEEAVRMVLQTKGKKVVLNKEASGWTLAEPKKRPAGFVFEPAQVPIQLNALRNLKATRLVEGVSDSGAGFSSPTVTVTVSRADGTSQSLKFGTERPGPTGSPEVLVRGGVDTHVYAIPVFERNRLEQGLDLFKQQPRPSMDGLKGLEGLPPDVRAKLEAQLRQQFPQ